jgi:DNA repair protein RadA/Sms
VGKSTLLLAVAHHVAESGAKPIVLYVSGEESVEQIGVRALRIGANSERLLLADENDLATLLGHIEEHDPGLVVVDSVQTIASGDIDGRAGGVSQVVEVTQVLSRVAKSRRMPLLLVGQSTKQDSVAGPRALEHLVDTVLTFDGDRNSMLRLLRATKNRYGPADEIVCFEQADDGLREVRDPSDLFRAHRDKPVPGTCVTVTIEGRRPMLAEIQALVTDTSPAPRRGVTGLDSNRVAMLIAVTERASTRKLGGDIFVATVGGAKISDPGSDLAVCIAVASAAVGQPMAADVLAIGEVALSGDIRPVPYLTQRVSEAARLGYKRVLLPKGTRRTLPRIDGIEYSEVAHLDEALARLRRLSVVVG